jgi:hypothetical protein
LAYCVEVELLKSWLIHVVHKKSHMRTLSRYLGNKYKFVREMQRHVQLILKKSG